MPCTSYRMPNVLWVVVLTVKSHCTVEMCAAGWVRRFSLEPGTFHTVVLDLREEEEGEEAAGEQEHNRSRSFLANSDYEEVEDGSRLRFLFGIRGCGS
jgi:hypothetical protein